jgi:hypothetical protein
LRAGVVIGIFNGGAHVASGIVPPAPIPRATARSANHALTGGTVLATSYPLLEAFWTILIFFALVVWIWLLFTVFADLFRRQDVSGWAKVGWIIFIIVLPYLGVFVYLIAEHKGMTERSTRQQEAAQTEMDHYVRSVAGKSDPTDQIAKAETLLKGGTISQAEFDQIKKQALAS